MTQVACVELETAKEEGRGCQAATSATFYRVMSFSNEGSALYDAGDLLQRVGDPDTTNLLQTIDRLAPRNQRGR